MYCDTNVAPNTLVWKQTVTYMLPSKNTNSYNNEVFLDAMADATSENLSKKWVFLVIGKWFFSAFIQHSIRISNKKKNICNFCLISSNSELKRRLRAEQKTKEKAEKEQAALQNGTAPSTKILNGAAINEAEITPNEFFKLRSAAVEKLKKIPGAHPYPHKFNVTTSLESFIEQYNHVADGETLDVTVSVAGRIHSIRGSGAKLIFYDLRGEGVKIQVMANARAYVNEGEFVSDNEKIRRGDIIGVEGSPGKTKKGELSIIPKKVSKAFTGFIEWD